MPDRKPDPTQSQLDKFKEAARELETDDNPKRFKERVGKPVEAGNKSRTDSTDEG